MINIGITYKYIIVIIDNNIKMDGPPEYHIK